jgi:NAD(P)-dependent dehydrogenase (short-subunit alcohol dehydrogenase family)
MGILEAKVALIAGGGTGIGRDDALRFAREGRAWPSADDAGSRSISAGTGK